MERLKRRCILMSIVPDDEGRRVSARIERPEASLGAGLRHSGFEFPVIKLPHFHPADGMRNNAVLHQFAGRQRRQVELQHIFRHRQQSRVATIHPLPRAVLQREFEVACGHSLQGLQDRHGIWRRSRHYRAAGKDRPFQRSRGTCPFRHVRSGILGIVGVVLRNSRQ